MGRKTIAALAGAALLGVGLLAGSSLAGGTEERTVAEPIVAKPIVATSAAAAGIETRSGAKAAARRRKPPLVRFFYARRPTVPPEGGAVVQPVLCPKGQGQPIAGGALTAVGISIVSLSRVHPQTGRRPGRTYFVGIEDTTNQNLPGSGAVVEVQCAKRMRVVK